MKLSKDSLEWALAHTLAHGDTNIFPVPFEYKAIQHSWNAQRAPLLDWLSSQDINSWVTRPFRRCLSPKQHYSFRVATQLDPLDNLVYAALVYEIGTALEERRVPTNKYIVHSHRFLPRRNGQFFSQNWHYESFRKRCQEEVDSNRWEYVVVADIADFYARIYSHPLENSLRSAAPNCPTQVNALMRMLKSWNSSVSYGIPVGPSPSHLLAEVTISDIDDLLLSENRTYCRFSDDYRIFCGSLIEAHEALAVLARALFENHGLTLERSKTTIVSIETFRDQYLCSPHATERQSLSDRFREALSKAGFDNPYQEVDFDVLDENVQREISAMNLREILDEQLKEREKPLDIPLVRFILRRFAQLDLSDAADTVLLNLERLYPLFKDVVEFLTSLRSLDEGTRHSLGQRLIDLLNNSLVAHLEYHRSWILNVFTNGREWDNDDRFIGLLSRFLDKFSQREIILALGRSGKQFWFKQNKRDFADLAPWEKRAFLAGASCLPGDEATHWYRSVKPQLDELETAVVDWASANRFGSI